MTADVCYVRRGLATILNYVEFDSQMQLTARQGSDKDADAVYNTFLKLGFTFYSAHCKDPSKTKCYGLRNGTTAETKELLAELLTDSEELEKYDCLVVVVASHGIRGSFVTYDDFLSIEQELISPFNDCSILKGKPKLFFIQACRPEYDVGDNASSTNVQAPEDIVSESDLPVGSDIFIAYPTIPGKYSYRHPNIGSWFLDELSKCLIRHAATKDLNELMREVRRNVADQQASGGSGIVKQCISTVDQLLRTVRFGVYPPQDWKAIRFLGDTATISDYVRRSELEDEIVERTKGLAVSTSPGVSLLVYGAGGIGKTTLLRQVLCRQFLTECGFSLRIWLNVFQIAKGPDVEDSFFEALAKLMKIQDGESYKGCVVTHLEDMAEKGYKLLLILDDVFNDKIVRCVRNLGDNVRTICVSRLNLSKQMPRFFGDPPIHIGEMSEEAILQMFDTCRALIEKRHVLTRLIKQCCGLPLLAQIIKDGLLTAETTELADRYLNRLEQQYPKALLGLKSEDDEKKEETIWKLLLIGFGDESAEFRRRYYAFLLFDEGSQVHRKDLAICWQCTALEASEYCIKFCNKSLLRGNQERTQFNLHSYLYGAALEYLTTEETSNDDIITSELRNEIKNGQSQKGHALHLVRRSLLMATMRSATGENALHLAVIGQRERLLRIIVETIRGDQENKLLLDLCSQFSTETHGHRLPLHLLLEKKWQIKGRNFGLDNACHLANRLLLREMSNALTLFSLKNQNGLTVLELLLENLENLRDGNWHENALLLCAGRGYRELLMLLLDNGASKTCLDESGNNALLIAANNFHTQIVFDLKKLSFDVNFRNKEGTTALMISSVHGNNSLCEELLKSHNIDINAQDIFGNTALTLALKNGKISTAQHLLDGGAKLVQFLLEDNVDVNSEINDDVTQLVTASRMGNAEVVKLLLEHNADVNTKSDDDVTPLLIASENGHTEVVELLLEHSADVNAKTNEDVTPLVMASQNGHVEVVKLLLEHNADVNVKNLDDVTPLFMASNHGHIEVVELLLEHHADVNAKANNGVTPVWMASQNGQVEVVKLLLEHNADVNAKRNDDEAPLFMASKNGHVDVVKLLLEHNADVNAEAKDGLTPLFIATFRGHFEVVNLLSKYQWGGLLCESLQEK